MRRFLKDRRTGRQDGMSLILTTLMMVFVTSIVGLSVDAGSVYVVKASASAAADAAALAAGRSLNLGDTVDAVQQSARASASRYFTANFPNGFMNVNAAESTVTTGFQMQTDASGNPNGVLTITVDARVKAPTYFMKVFNWGKMDVVARGVATRRSLVLALILDRSGSMGSRETAVGVKPTSMGNEACENMVYGALQFVDLFSPYDYVGLVSFASTPRLDFSIQSDFKRPGGIRDSIANIDCGGSTNTTGALWMANQQVVARNLRLAVNAIVLFTDGSPNGINFVAPIKRLVDNRYGTITSSSTPASPNNGSTNINNCRNRTDRICNGVPVVCSSSAASATPVGQLNSGSDPLGSRSTFQRSMLSDPNNAWSLPSSCATGTNSTTTQSIAYIPQFDRWGNRTWGHSPAFKDDWVFEVNEKCAPAFVVMSPGAPSCRNIGGTFAAYPSVGAGSNFFPAGHAYAGRLRPDTPNALRVAGMNSAMDMAANIRANTTYNIIISTIFLMNGSDAIERDFMPIMSNQPTIPPLPYDYYAAAKPNPYYQPNQQTGTHVPLTNRNDLVGAFMQIASSLLRISQ